MTALLVRLAGVLLMLTALALPLAQEPDRAVETLVGRWAPPPSEFIELAGQLVHLRDVGPRDDPAPIVLVHGTGASLHTWEGWAAALRGRHRVVTFDLPGFGLSGPNADGVYSAERDARFVLALLDRLGIQRCTAGGNSLGGEVAWRLALLAPRRVERLLLVDATGPAFEPESVPPGFLLAGIPGLNRLGDHLLPRALVEASLRSVYGEPSRVTSALVDRYFELALRQGNRKALRQRLAQWSSASASRAGVPALLGQVQAPTLLLWGGRDRLVPPAVGDVFVRALPQATLRRFAGLGHVPQEEDPKATVAALEAWLASPPVERRPP